MKEPRSCVISRKPNSCVFTLSNRCYVSANRVREVWWSALILNDAEVLLQTYQHQSLIRGPGGHEMNLLHVNGKDGVLQQQFHP